MGWQCFDKAEKNCFLKTHTDTADPAKTGPEEWYNFYVRANHPELALLGIRVLSQVISA
jgi:hypothetical protein